jgi:ABC-2 type transport system ATP-binding protein
MTDVVVPVGPAELSEPAVPPAVRISKLTKRYGSTFAVRELDLEIEQGAIYGLVGPNGAGKTTTFSVLASLLEPTAGKVELLGLDPARQPGAVRRVMGYMPDVLGLYDDLRVDEYLDFFAASYHVPKAARAGTIDGLLELVDLTSKRDAIVNSLSRGMKQRLSLARALVHDPQVLILDEPASGLDPRARVELRNLLGELRDLGKTIVVSSHILSELAEMCTSIGIMESGQLLATGAPSEIRDRLGGVRSVRVRFAGGVEEQFEVADEAEQAALVRRLVVDDGRDVVECIDTGGGLEELFMKITGKGDE